MTDTALEEITDIYPQAGSQHEMLTSPATEVFLGGESGGGKTFGFLLDFLEDIDNVNANGLFLRRNYPDLEGVIHDAIGLYRGFGANFNDQKHLFTFPSGARLRFGHMNTVMDVYNYTGQQRTHYYWDELPQFPRLPYLLLMAWLRSPDQTIFKRIRSSGNPDGEGILWVKDRFVDKLEPFEIGHFLRQNDRDVKMPPGTRGAMSRQFIPCYREENLALMEKDPDYRDRLEQLPEDKKRAYKYGIWDVADKPFQLIKSKWFSNALNGQNKPRAGIAALGADYAESGDFCTLCVGQGNRVLRFLEWPGMDTEAFAALVEEQAKKAEAKYGQSLRIGVDSIGPGTGVYHKLRKGKFGGRLDPMRYKDQLYELMLRHSIRIKFNNLRSQMYWKLREDFEKGLIDLSPLQGTQDAGTFYENMHMLQEELLAHTYAERNGTIIIVEKDILRKPENLARSPDRADALAIWNWVRDKHKIGTPPPPKSTFEALEQKRRVNEARRSGRTYTQNDPNMWQAL